MQVPSSVVAMHAWLSRKTELSACICERFRGLVQSESIERSVSKSCFRMKSDLLLARLIQSKLDTRQVLPCFKVKVHHLNAKLNFSGYCDIVADFAERSAC